MQDPCLDTGDRVEKIRTLSFVLINFYNCKSILSRLHSVGVLEDGFVRFVFENYFSRSKEEGDFCGEGMEVERALQKLRKVLKPRPEGKVRVDPKCGWKWH